MGYSGNDPSDLKRIYGTENLGPQEIERLKADLIQAGKIEKSKENPAYEAKESKVYKGKFAPVGKVFLVVTHKSGGKIYTSWILISGSGLTAEDKEKICFNLWESMAEKYGLKGPLKGLAIK